MSHQCDRCQKKVEDRWKYCRYCGNKLTRQPARQVEIEFDPVAIQQEVFQQRIDSQPEPEPEPEPVFDKQLYYRVLSTRAERSIIIKKKNELKAEIASLLEQLKSGLVDREYVTPKIKDLKEKVTEISNKEDQYSEIPEELPIEILNEEIESAEQRMKRIDKLKNDENVSKQTIEEARKRSKESLHLLKDQQSKIFGHLREWKSELQQKKDKLRKDVEHLYVKFKTEELTQEAYSERKERIIEDIQNYEETIYNIEQILS